MRLFLLGLVGIGAAALFATSSRAESTLRYRTLDKMIRQFASDAANNVE